jgi:hypothetical protein
MIFKLILCSFVKMPSQRASKKIIYDTLKQASASSLTLKKRLRLFDFYRQIICVHR